MGYAQGQWAILACRDNHLAPANYWISNEIYVLLFRDRGLELLAAKTNLLSQRRSYPSSRKRKSKEANLMRRISLSQCGVILVFLFVFGLYESQALAQAARGSYTTTADVALRSGPGMKYPVVTTLPKGLAINVVGREGYWLKIESKHGGQPGYVDEQFAQPVGTTQAAAPKTTTTPVAGAYKTIKDVDLRQGPGAKYPVVAKIPSGIRVNVVRAEGDWLRVESKRGAKPGYLEKRLVEPWDDRY